MESFNPTEECSSSTESGWTKYIVSQSNGTTNHDEYFSDDDVEVHVVGKERRKKKGGGSYDDDKQHGISSDEVDSLASDASSGPSCHRVAVVKEDVDEQEDSSSKDKFSFPGKKMIGGSKEGKETRKQGSGGVKGNRLTGYYHGKKR